MNRTAKELFLAVVLLAALTPAGRAQQLQGERFALDSIAAIVGSEIILRSEIDLQLYIETQSRGIALETLSEAQIDTMRRGILDNLINQKVIVARAVRDSIVVSRSEVDTAVDQWLAQIKQSMGGEAAFQAQLAAENMTERDLRERRWEMAQDELLRSRLFQQIGIRMSPVSRREGEAYLQENAAALMPLRMIFLAAPPEAELDSLAHARAREVRRRIVEGGEEFGAIARTESADGGSGAAGGDLGEAPRGTYVATIDSTVWNTPVGEVSAPVRSQFGWHLVQVTARDSTAARARHILIGLQADQALASSIDEVERALAEGESFGTLITRHSQAPESEQNEGFFAVLPEQTTPQESNLPAEWINELRQLIPGDWAGPWESPEGVFFFERLPMDGDTIQLILRVDFARVEAYIQRQRQIAQIEEFVSELRSETYIEIKP